jgi:uncharacterized membrane protein
MKLAGARRVAQLDVAAWFAFAVYLVLVVGFAWKPTPFAQGLGAIGVAGACAHAVLFYGWRNAAVLLAICLVTTFAMENIGSLTGFPFGRYHFEVGSDLIHVVAAFVMAQWDVVMDPSGSTIAKAWIWHDGGGYFGAPLSNYLGWLLTGWLFYQAFAIYLGRREIAAQTIERQRIFGLVAILLYLSSGLTHVIPWMMGQSGEVTDAANYVWRVQDVRESAVIVMLFTMFFTSVLAALRLADEDSRAGQQAANSLPRLCDRSVSTQTSYRRDTELGRLIVDGLGDEPYAE